MGKRPVQAQGISNQQIVQAWERIDARQGRLGLVALWDLGRELGVAPGGEWAQRIRQFVVTNRWVLIYHDFPAKMTPDQRVYCVDDPVIGWTYAWIRPRRSR